MREEIIIQGQTVGYVLRDRMQAFLEKEAPDYFVENLIAAGYAVCRL